MKLKILFLIILLNCLSPIIVLEYKKNKNIKIGDKSEHSRVFEVEDPSIVENKINLKKSNFFLIFYAEWCNHCKEFLSILDDVSKFKLARKFDFLKINCAAEKLKDLCEIFKINRFPTPKVYLKGEETNFLPMNRDLESILEYIDKINSDTIIEITKNKILVDFKKNYGDVSFLLVDDGDLNDLNLNEEKKILKQKLLKCYEDIANYYKPVFYFAYMDQKKYKNYYDIKFPAIISLGLNEEFNIHQNLFNFFDNKVLNAEKLNESCLKIRNFVEINKFPVLKKLDHNYLTKIQREKKILIIVAINRADNQHISFLNNYFHYLAVENRDKYVFSYLDFNEDKYFFNFFNIDLTKFSGNNHNQIENDIKPIIIIYNFLLNKYFIDSDSFSDKKNYLKISDNRQLQDLIRKINENEIRWTSGYLIEDIITDILGSNTSREVLLMIYSGIFFFFLAGCLIFVCTCIENKNSEVFDKIIKKKNQ